MGTLSTRRPALVLILLSLVLMAPGVTNIPMLDRDDAHFAQATRQMLESGNFFQIRFQDKTRFQKPPGINWLQAISVKLFSAADSTAVWPYRIISVLGGLLAVLLTYIFARRITDPPTALLSGILLACSLLLNIESHLLTIDAMLLASIVLMQYALYQVYTQQKHWAWPIIFWLSLSAGICLKGVTPLIAIGTLLYLRDWQLIKNLKPGMGLVILLLSSTWLLKINRAEDTNYLWQLIQKDLAPKLQGGHEGHGAPPGTHLFLLPLTFWPSSILLGIGAHFAWREKSHPNTKFLLAWILPTWLFFELMPTKLPQYLLPIFPALAILCAQAFRQNLPLNKTLYALWGMMTLVFGISFFWVDYYLTGTIHWYAAIPVLLALMVILKPRTLILAAVGIYGLFWQFLLPSWDALWVSEKLAQAIPSTNNPVLSLGYNEPSLVFRLGTKNINFINPADLNHYSNQFLILDSRYQHLIPNYPVINKISGFNYSKGQWINLNIYKLPG